LKEYNGDKNESKGEKKARERMTMEMKCGVENRSALVNQIEYMRILFMPS
jgi:hypothetical protein